MDVLARNWTHEVLEKVVCGKCQGSLKYLGYPCFYCGNCDVMIIYASEELPLTQSVNIPMKSGNNNVPRVFEPKITLQIPESLINPHFHVHMPLKKTRKKTWLEKEGKKTVQIEEEEAIPGQEAPRE